MTHPTHSVTWQAPTAPQGRPTMRMPEGLGANDLDLNGFGQPKRVSAPTFTPTREQRLALDGVRRGEDMVVSASAGSGKTSFIVEAAAQMHRDNPVSWGRYIVLNSAIAADVDKRFVYGNVTGSTIHSLANRAVRQDRNLSPMMNRLSMNRDDPRYLRPADQPDHFGVPKRVYFYRKPLLDDEGALTDEYEAVISNGSVLPNIPGMSPDGPHSPELCFVRNGYVLCQSALRTIRNWCTDDADRIGPEHVTLPEYLGHSRSTVNFAAHPEDVAVQRYLTYVSRLAQFIWDNDIIVPHGRMEVEHDHYLKAWALTKPSITKTLGHTTKGVLFFDEAQDSRPVTTKLVMDQRPEMQVVMCGDASQGINRFMGCVNALGQFAEFDGVKHYRMTQTFRFGPDIAAVANTVLPWVDVADVRVLPNMARSATVTYVSGGSPALKMVERGNALDAVICRTNAAVIDSVIDLLLAGVKVHTTANAKRFITLSWDIISLRKGDVRAVRDPSMRQFNSYEMFTEFMGIANGFSKIDNPDHDPFLRLACTHLKVEIDQQTFSALRGVWSRGPSDTITAMKKLTSQEKDADVTVSTVHKAKGREWDNVLVDMSYGKRSSNEDSVFVSDPLPSGDDLQDLMMLAYVALTRAKTHLYITEETSRVIPALKDTGLQIHVRSGLAHPDEGANDFPERAPLPDPITATSPSGDFEEEWESLLIALLPKLGPKSARAMINTMRDHSEPVHPADVVSAILIAANKFCDRVEHDKRLAYTTGLVSLAGVPALLDAAKVLDMGAPPALAGNMIALPDSAGVTYGAESFLTHLRELLTEPDLPSRPGIYIPA